MVVTCYHNHRKRVQLLILLKTSHSQRVHPWYRGYTTWIIQMISSQDPFLNDTCQDPFCESDPIHRYQGLGFAHIFLGDTIQSTIGHRNQMRVRKMFFPFLETRKATEVDSFCNLHAKFHESALCVTHTGWPRTEGRHTGLTLCCPHLEIVHYVGTRIASSPFALGLQLV